MEFPGKSNNFFSKKEIELLNEWRKNMAQTPEGKQIIENIETDNKVPGNIWVKVLKNLTKQVKEGNNCVDAFGKAIDDKMLLKGPSIDRKHLDESFLKLMKVRSLFRYLKDNIPIFRDKKGQKQLCNRISDGTITLNSFKNKKLSGRKPVVWATFADEVERQRMINDNVDDLCDKLGLLDFDKCEYVIEFRYLSKKLKKIKFPTIIEAGANPAFYPTADADDDKYGYTWDLKNKERGLPEVVHEPILFQEIDSIKYLGHKSRNASSLF